MYASIRHSFISVIAVNQEKMLDSTEFLRKSVDTLLVSVGSLVMSLTSPTAGSAPETIARVKTLEESKLLK